MLTEPQVKGRKTRNKYREKRFQHRDNQNRYRCFGNTQRRCQSSATERKKKERKKWKDGKLHKCVLDISNNTFTLKCNIKIARISKFTTGAMNKLYQKPVWPHSIHRHSWCKHTRPDIQSCNHASASTEQQQGKSHGSQSVLPNANVMPCRCEGKRTMPFQHRLREVHEKKQN